MKRIMLAMVLVLFFTVNADALSWDWSFGSEAGNFVTNGDTPTVGWYDVQDFVVTQSARGAAIGSWAGGQYDARGYWTWAPYRFQWGGDSVTKWDCDGLNLADWLVFKDIGPNNFYLFGWQTRDVNVVNQAAYFLGEGNANQRSYSLTVSPVVEMVTTTRSMQANEAVPVPEPATLLLLGVGLMGIVARMRGAHGI